jgi:hypothetical protein
VGCAGDFVVPGEVAFLSICRTIVATRLESFLIQPFSEFCLKNVSVQSFFNS